MPFKPGDPWPCPVCGERFKTILPSGALRRHKSHLGDANAKGYCPGGGFSPVKPKLPQLQALGLMPQEDDNAG